MARKTKTVDRNDTWQNLLTGLGTLQRDKRRHSQVFAEPVTQEEAEEIYRATRTAQRAVEVPTLVQLGNGFKVVVEDAEPADQEEGADMSNRLDAIDVEEDPGDEHLAAKAVNNVLEDLEVVAAFMKANNWARAYGGAAILMGIDDGRKFEKPVNEKAIKAVRYLTVLSKREVRPVKWNSNKYSPGYGQPVAYHVQRDTVGGVTGGAGGFEVHASRLIIWPGWSASRRSTQGNNGWGDSIFTALRDSLRDYEVSHQTIPILLQDHGEGVWRVNGLAGIMGGDGAAVPDTYDPESGIAPPSGGEIILQRMRVAAMVRSVLGALVTDKEDEFTRMGAPLSGLGEVLDRVSKKWAADVGVPPGLLFGDEPAGLNATGDTPMQFFYKEQGAEQRYHLAPKARRLVRYIFLSLEGPTEGTEPSSWAIDFGPMYMPTPAEENDERQKIANADKAYVDAGVLTPEEVAISRFGQPGGWSRETKLNQKVRDAVEQADQKLQQQQLEKAKAMGAQVPGVPGAKPPAPKPVGE